MKRYFSFTLNTFCYVFILVFIGIVLIYDQVYEGFFPSYFIWYSASVGAVSAIITLLFFTEAIIKTCPTWLRFLLFFICLVGYVTTATICFGLVDPSRTDMMITMLVMIGLNFVIVWCVNLFSFKQQQKELIERLREFNETIDD